MELSELKDKICSTYCGEKEQLEKLLTLFDEDKAVFPFNEYELLLTTMLAQGGIKYDEYKAIRAEYLSHNPNLWVLKYQLLALLAKRMLKPCYKP